MIPPEGGRRISWGWREGWGRLGVYRVLECERVWVWELGGLGERRSDASIVAGQNCRDVQIAQPRTKPSAWCSPKCDRSLIFTQGRPTLSGCCNDIDCGDDVQHSTVDVFIIILVDAVGLGVLTLTTFGNLSTTFSMQLWLWPGSFKWWIDLSWLTNFVVGWQTLWLVDKLGVGIHESVGAQTSSDGWASSPSPLQPKCWWKSLRWVVETTHETEDGVAAVVNQSRSLCLSVKIVQPCPSAESHYMQGKFSRNQFWDECTRGLCAHSRKYRKILEEFCLNYIFALWPTLLMDIMAVFTHPQCHHMNMFWVEEVSVRMHTEHVFVPRRIQENVFKELFMYWFRARGNVRVWRQSVRGKLQQNETSISQFEAVWCVKKRPCNIFGCTHAKGVIRQHMLPRRVLRRCLALCFRRRKAFPEGFSEGVLRRWHFQKVPLRRVPPSKAVP